MIKGDFKMLIQLHMLQNYAPSNLNRDETGSPKDAVFGGVRRGRISSQCLKRSIRRSHFFVDAFGKDNLLATRTKRLPSLLNNALIALGVDDTTRSDIVARAPEIGQESGKTDIKKVDPEKAETRQLIFLGASEVDSIAAKLLDIYREVGAKKWSSLKIEEITTRLQGELPRSVDVAMFGRMTTSSAFEDVHAAVQVAHALSTNALTQEFDYFTAVDDITLESGAGMIGDIEFNSSTYYKYFNIHWEKLVENLGGDQEVARQSIDALIHAAALAQPSGKQNGFAAQNLPDFVLVEVSSKNLPVSYANAFLKPVRPTAEKSLLEQSIDALQSYVERTTTAYELPFTRAYLSLENVDWPNANRLPSLQKLARWTTDQLQAVAVEA
jgi:CRISPR system Cascade subunit CasC